MVLIPSSEFKPELSLMGELKPEIVISKQAHKKMSMYVDVCKLEIGWMGTAIETEANKQYYIEDVFLFKQTVSAGTTKALPQAFAELAESLTDEQNENLRFWGHSHVNMAVTFSATDHTNMKEIFFDGGRRDWYIGNVCNKEGKMKFYLYLPNNKCFITDVPWRVEQSEEDILEWNRFKDEINSFCTVSNVTPISNWGARHEWWGEQDAIKKAERVKNWQDRTPGNTPTIVLGTKFVPVLDRHGKETQEKKEVCFIINKMGEWHSDNGSGFVLRKPAKKIRKEHGSIEAMIEKQMKDKDNLTDKEAIIE